MYLRFIYMLLLVVVGIYAPAQQNDDNCFAGNHAVFVYNSLPPDTVAFYLQRREKEGDTRWVTIRTYRSPNSAGDVLRNYREAQELFPEFDFRFDAAEAWRKWKKYGTFDSLLNEVGYLPGQMAFHIALADSAVRAGKTYQYRVMKERETEEQANNRIGNWVAFPAGLQTPVPRFLNRQTERDAIILQWFATGNTQGERFNVYRAADNGGFERIDAFAGIMHRGDTTVYTVQDNKVVFSEMYQYYIVPVNAFGGGGNILSDTVPATCMNAAQLLTPQFVRADENLQRKAIMVHYLLPDPEYIGSVHVMRSDAFDDGYAEIGVTRPEDTVFVDYRIVPGKKYYYYLQMTDKMGRNATRSIKTFGLLQDTLNEFPARFVTAERVKEGVRISWQNPPDTSVISGYYVCRKLSSSAGFERITDLLPAKDSINSYLDTSANLQPSLLYVYSVISESLSNKVSKHSVLAYVTGVPSATTALLPTPRNVKVAVETSRVRLFWYDMRLLDPNLAFYNIYRKSNNDTGFTLISSHYPVDFTSYQDSITEPGVGYVYAMECVDDNDRVSAQTITERVYMPASPLLPPVIAATAADNSIMLTWERIIDKRVKGYTVYRYTRGNEPEKIARVDAEALRYEDTKASKGNTYYYYLQPEDNRNTFSDAVSNKVYVAY